MSICFRTPLLPVRFIIAIRGRNSIWNGSALKRVRARTVFPPPRRRPASVYFVFFGEAKRTNREGPSPLRSGSSSIGVLIKRVTGTGRGGGWRETYFSPGRAQKTRALRAKKKWLFLFFFPPPHTISRVRRVSGFCRNPVRNFGTKGPNRTRSQSDDPRRQIMSLRTFPDESFGSSGFRFFAKLNNARKSSPPRPIYLRTTLLYTNRFPVYTYVHIVLGEQTKLKRPHTDTRMRTQCETKHQRILFVLRFSIFQLVIVKNLNCFLTSKK